MEQKLQKKFELRYQLLRFIYDEVDGQSDLYPSYSLLNDFCSKSRVAMEGTTAAFDWLANEGLVARFTNDSFHITHDGVREIEEASRRPAEGTEHFEPVVISNVTNVYGGQVGSVQTGSQNTANVFQAAPVVDDILKLLAQLRAGVNQLPQEHQGEATAMIEVLEEEAKQPKPRAALVRRCSEWLNTHMGTFVPMIQMIVELFLKK